MDKDREKRRENERALKAMVGGAKRKIKEYPESVQKYLEDIMVAEIIFNSEAIEEDTLPRKEAMHVLLEEARGKRGHLFDL